MRCRPTRQPPATVRWHFASIASRHRIPFVVIPAETRNHFALDLGLDRADVPGALKAYEDGVDTAIDLAEVNGRMFVNDVSMGVYASIVQSADYRNAKVQTAAAMLPDLLGPETPPLDLHFTVSSGREAVGPQLLLVSTTLTSWPSCAAEAPASVSTAAHWGSSTYGSSRRPTPRSSQRWRSSGKSGALPRGVSGRRRSRSEFRRNRGDRDRRRGQNPRATAAIRQPASRTDRLPRSALGRSPAARAVRLIAKPTVVARCPLPKRRPDRCHSRRAARAYNLNNRQTMARLKRQRHRPHRQQVSHQRY
jgi:hypothetical protein